MWKMVLFSLVVIVAFLCGRFTAPQEEFEVQPMLVVLQEVEVPVLMPYSMTQREYRQVRNGDCDTCHTIQGLLPPELMLPADSTTNTFEFENMMQQPIDIY